MGKKYRGDNRRRCPRHSNDKKNYPSRHHLTPKSRGGGMEEENLLRLWRDRHDCWHSLFGEKTLEEVRDVMERIIRMKGRR